MTHSLVRSGLCFFVQGRIHAFQLHLKPDASGAPLSFLRHRYSCAALVFSRSPAVRHLMSDACTASQRHVSQRHVSQRHVSQRHASLTICQELPRYLALWADGYFDGTLVLDSPRLVARDATSVLGCLRAGPGLSPALPPRCPRALSLSDNSRELTRKAQIPALPGRSAYFFSSVSLLRSLICCQICSVQF